MKYETKMGRDLDMLFLKHEHLKAEINKNYVRKYDEIEYFSKGVSLGKNCFPERTRKSDFRRELCRLTVRDPNDPLKSIDEVMKSIDRVIVRQGQEFEMDSNLPEFKIFLTELTQT